MNFSKPDLMLITTAIEQLYIKGDAPRFTEEGIKRLADIQASIAAELLGISKQEVLPRITSIMLTKIEHIERSAEETDK